MIPILSLGIGLLLGWICGGEFRRIGDTTTRWGWLAVALFVLQGAARGRLPGFAGWASQGAVVWGACSLALAVILLLELRTPGMFLAAVGILLNLLVVLLNGAMPVGPSAGSGEAGVLNAAQHAFYQPVSPQTIWRVFADVLPLPAFGSLTLVSVGDVLLVLGISVWVVGVMVTPERECAGTTG